MNPERLRFQARALEEMGLSPRWVRRESAVHPVASGAATSEMTSADRATDIASMDHETLRAAVAACRACRLCETRTQTVFGVGVAHPEWMIVGEAPGADEDARGEPFVGQAGRLLDNMLASVGLSRTQNVFIANVLKCRPPGNRNPQQDEVQQCDPYLRRQIELLEPRLIVALGKFAAATLLGSDASISSLRGRVHRIAIGAREFPVVVTYHPAYLLRAPQEKSKAWADLCFARALLAVAPRG